MREGAQTLHNLPTPAAVPGIGPKLAGRIHEQLGIETLADLETAAYDGCL